jgi:hypothetical protein
MKIKSFIVQTLTVFLALLLVVPPGVFAQDAGGKPAVKQEELDQVLAPVALYPDSLLTQILMASTYPLEVVQADRWAKQNKDMKGDAFEKALEAQSWDPSVKSLVNFPQVLTMMSGKLDWTQKLGDAFLAQQENVMKTVQKLRAKAQAAGNLKTTKEQKVVVEKEVIIIESASPTVVYVPTYNPTIVYGAWWYPAYPPPPVYAYPPPVATPFAFAAGVAVGAAWGYAWGHADWHGGSGGYGNVKVNYNQNVNINNNINRSNYAKQQPAGGQWNKQATPAQKSQAQQAARGYSGSAQQNQAGQQAKQAGQNQAGQQAKQAGQNQAGQQAKQAGQKSGGAFEGMDKGGSAAKDASSRGGSSRESMSGGGSRGGGGGSSSGFSGGGSRGGGGGGGGSRGGGGGGGGRR